METLFFFCLMKPVSPQVLNILTSFDVQWKIVVYLFNNHFLSHTHICRGPDVEDALVDEN